MGIPQGLAIWLALFSWCQLTVLGNEVQCTYKGAKAIFDPFSPDARPGSNALVSRFPCSFQMANYRCGRVQTVVIPENSMDATGVPLLSDITVLITPLRENMTSQQILKISVKKLRRYISNGNFTKSPWRWSYVGTRPKRRHRIVGSYNETTRTAVISSGGMEVTFNGGRVLSARCSKPNFKVYGDYPEGVLCGPATDNNWNTYFNSLYDTLPVCSHHRYNYHFDYIALALQKDYQTKPLCMEAAEIMTSGTCSNLADKVYECSRLYEHRPSPYPSDTYGNCIRNHTIDPFKVYVACLRALCGSEGCSSTDTCNTLREVEASCKDNTDINLNLAHSRISDIISRTQCPPLPEIVTIALELGAECNSSSQCGANAQCAEDPAICTCKLNYTAHNGVCGRKSYERCTTDSDCLPFSYCELTAYNGPLCYCNLDTFFDEENFCYKRNGESCEQDWDCNKNTFCSNGTCACKENFIPDYNKNRIGTNKLTTFLTNCYLKTGEECNDTADCVLNAECVGSPAKCTCQPGYILDKGRCGKPVGSTCVERYGTECVPYANCIEGTCQCAYGHIAEGQICVQHVWCQYSLTHRPAFQPFPAYGEQDVMYSMQRYPCRYKLANIQCGNAQVVVTVDHAMDRGYRFGRVYMGNITVNISRVDSQGVSTSQINTLDIHKLLKMEETGNYNMTIWDYSYAGPEEPEENDRIRGHYNRTEWAPYLTSGHVTVNVTEGGNVLTIGCTDPNYSAVEEWPETFCGGPRNTMMADIPVDPWRQTTDSHHVPGHAFDSDIALMLQNIPQSNPLCEEVSLIPTLSCENFGEKRYKISESVKRFKDCMEDLKMDSLKVYVALTRALCGTGSGSTANVDTCHTFRELAGHCRTHTGELNLIQLLSNAGCNTTFTTTTTTTRAPRGGWK